MAGYACGILYLACHVAASAGGIIPALDERPFSKSSDNYWCAIFVGSIFISHKKVNLPMVVFLRIHIFKFLPLFDPFYRFS